MSTVLFTRAELYDLVWSQPLSKIAESNNLTASAIATACRKLRVPRPLPGYWTRIKTKKHLLRKKLPEDYYGPASIEITLKDSHTKTIDSLSPLREEISKSINLGTLTKTKPHPLIQAVKKDFDERKKQKWRTEILVSPSETLKTLNIRVSRSTIQRSLLFFDSFIKVLHVRGHEVSIKYGRTNAVIFGQEIEISVRERTTRTIVKDPYQRTEYKPTGIMVFQLGRGYRAKEWKDGKQKLEDQMPTILAALEVYATRVKKEHEEWKIRQALQEEKLRLKEELQQRKVNELERFKNLLKDARRYQQVKLLREFVTHLRTTQEKNETLIAYIEWAENKIDWYDPIISAPDDLLSNADLDSLIFQK